MHAAGRDAFTHGTCQTGAWFRMDCEQFLCDGDRGGIRRIRGRTEATVIRGVARTGIFESLSQLDGVHRLFDK